MRLLHLLACAFYCSGLVTAAWVNNRRLRSRSASKNLPRQSRHFATVEGNQLQQQPLWTAQEIDDFASERGLIISFTTVGPVYRAVARAKHDESMVIGYVEGFVRPTGQILHLDKMEVYQPIIKRVKRQVPGSLDVGGVSFAIGLLMGYKCLLHGKEKECNVAEFLAIDDEDFQHKRLVRYYKRIGFQVVKYVGEDIRDIPDRLVWGGCGTLMNENIGFLMQKWVKLFDLIKNRTTQ